MRRVKVVMVLIQAAIGLLAQEAAKPTFDVADAHVSPRSANPQNQFVRNSGVHGGRWEIKSATMLDLVRFAYGFQADKILGGPNWLEMDRFDVTAKVPADSSSDTQKLMLQALLAERFALKAHEEKKPLPTFALTLGKKPQLKEADGTEETGCKPQAGSQGPSGPGEGGIVMFSGMGTSGGAPVTIRLGPGMQVTYQCRNVSMDRFVELVRGMIGAQMGNNPILNETGLKGNWNFDLRYSMNLNGMPGDSGDRISLATAVDKQLGLILDPRQVATPVLIVDSANEKPTPNPPGVDEALPPIAVPTEFEVASVKPAEPITGPMMMRFGMQPGGRFQADRYSLRMLIDRAFNSNNREEIVDVPAFASTERFDITARAGGLGASAGTLDNEQLAPMIRSLLVERFKMTYHKEERPVTTYSLVAAKPKFKKADPANRSNCKNQNAPAGSPPGTRVLVCQNVTMGQFAERLQGMAQEMVWPVEDATGLEGNWDLTLTFSFAPNMAMVRAVGGGDSAAGPAGSQAAEPTGGYTIFEAMEKQLGLKLEKQKKNMPVVAIDHIEQKPTEN